jgi:hypothetical protein
MMAVHDVALPVTAIVVVRDRQQMRSTAAQ